MSVFVCFAFIYLFHFGVHNQFFSMHDLSIRLFKMMMHICNSMDLWFRISQIVFQFWFFKRIVSDLLQLWVTSKSTKIFEFDWKFVLINFIGVFHISRLDILNWILASDNLRSASNIPIYQPFLKCPCQNPSQMNVFVKKSYSLHPNIHTPPKKMFLLVYYNPLFIWY